MRQPLEAIAGLEVKVSGRTFIPATRTTIQQDLFVMSRMRDTGLDKLVDNIDLKQFKLTKYAEEVIVRAYMTGMVFEVLAGLLVEQGKKWSEKSAMANAEFFANLDDDQDKENISRPLVSVVLHFFMRAVNERQTFPTFTAKEGEQQNTKDGESSISEVPQKSLEPMPSDEKGSQDEPEVIRISENGITLSENLPTTSPTNSTESSSGSAETP